MKFVTSTFRSNVWRSRNTIDFFAAASQDQIHGPENIRRCGFPSERGPGLKKICPAKGVEPGDAAPRPSPVGFPAVFTLITEGSTKYTALPVFQIPLVSAPRLATSPL